MFKMTSARRNLILLFLSCAMIGCVYLMLESLSYPWRVGRSSHPGNDPVSKPKDSVSASFSITAFSSSSAMGQTDEDRSRLSLVTKAKLRSSRLSKLGEWLRAPEDAPRPSANILASGIPEENLILVWKYGSFVEQRHIRHGVGNDSDSSSPFEGCSVKNCVLSYRDDDLETADAVIFHLHRTSGIKEIPLAKGKPEQIWIFMTDESPLHTFLYGSNNQDISAYDNIFDWSMTYREDSDIPVPYGRTIARSHFPVNERRRLGGGRKTKLVAIMGSNCSASRNNRWKYVKKLKRLLGNKLDVYGRCLGGNVTACPGHFHRDCPALRAYKFYLAFENSNCREYITEKVYWNAYEKRSVPVIMGAPRTDCERLLPPRSYIHVDDFLAPRNLADYLRYLDDNDNAYDEYHQWRSSYIVANEHGYFGSISKHYCRACEALLYNERPLASNKYRRIGDYWNASRDCHPYHSA